MQNKIVCIFHNFTMEVSMPQIINTKKHTKTAYSSRVTVQYNNRKTLQLNKEYFTYFTR